MRMIAPTFQSTNVFWTRNISKLVLVHAYSCRCGSWWHEQILVLEERHTKGHITSGLKIRCNQINSETQRSGQASICWTWLDMYINWYTYDMWVVWCAVTTLLCNKCVAGCFFQALYCNVYGDPGMANAAVWSEGMAFNSRLDRSSFPLPSLCGDVVHAGGCFTCGSNRLANKMRLKRAQDEMAVHIESRGIMRDPGIKMARTNLPGSDMFWSWLPSINYSRGTSPRWRRELPSSSTMVWMRLLINENDWERNHLTKVTVASGACDWWSYQPINNCTKSYLSKHRVYDSPAESKWLDEMLANVQASCMVCVPFVPWFLFLCAW